MMSVLFKMSLATISKNMTTRFVHELMNFLSMPEFFLVSGLYLFIFQSAWFGYLNYNIEFLQAALPVITVFAMIGLYMWTLVIFMLDRKGGIWETIKSKST
jgi:uncharacterized membrane protein YcfT